MSQKYESNEGTSKKDTTVVEKLAEILSQKNQDMIKDKIIKKRIFNEEVFKPKTKLFIKRRSMLSQDILDNDFWEDEFEAKVDQCREDILYILNMDYFVYQKILVGEVEDGFCKIKVIE